MISSNFELNTRDLIDALLITMAVEVRCMRCTEIEYIMALEGDEPFSDEFLANYVCAECGD